MTFTLDLESALADLARARRGGRSIHRILEHLIQSESLHDQAAAHLIGASAPDREHAGQIHHTASSA